MHLHSPAHCGDLHWLNHEWPRYIPALLQQFLCSGLLYLVWSRVGCVLIEHGPGEGLAVQTVVVAPCGQRMALVWSRWPWG